MTVSPSTFRIGVDVGGTNTDVVLLNLTSGVVDPVVASHKAPTTADITTGIQNAIKETLAQTTVDIGSIQAVVIGTTSFVNSLVERDTTKLQRVAVIRLSSVYSQLAPPFVSFPYALRRILEGPTYFAEGGLQVDGSEIESVSVDEIRSIAASIKQTDGIEAVVVSGCYSPIDREIRQEELVRDILQQELPDVRITISKQVANIGIMQRENASILNAALRTFAEKTVAGFKDSISSLNLTCPLFLTSNDGTLMACDQAATFPIRTFSSGPTNSMRGANFLAGLGDGKKETALVIDVGGTTTEIGVLLPTGFPRQAAATHELCGVSLNFSMPHVQSIGLGGGSRVRQSPDGGITIGPDSVGYRLTEEAQCFGGQTLTTTDIAVASGSALIGDRKISLSKEIIKSAERKIKSMIELAIDGMKTSASDIPVYLVGGGAVLVPDDLRGVSQVHRFPHCDVANAVGAAVAQVSGTVDTFEDTSVRPVKEVQREVEQRAIDEAVASGSDRAETSIVESECIPIAYTTGKCRFYVKAAGPWKGTAEVSAAPSAIDKTISPISSSSKPIRPATPANAQNIIPADATDPEYTADDLLQYRPKVKNHEWYLSELDLEWIATGCYILGTGGGGNPWTMYLAIRELVRRGSIVRIIDVNHLPEDKLTCWGGGIGSPEVGAERPVGARPGEAVEELLKFMRLEDKLGAMCAIEIGGGNGMVGMLAASSGYLDVPVVDGDFMGRAYPTGWQTTLQVVDPGNRAELVLPNAMCSGNGTTTFMTSVKHFKDVDKILRAGCIEMGTAADVAARPLTKPQMLKALIRNTLSQSWRLGRAVALANKTSQIGNIGRILVEACGGDQSAKVLFRGKIVEVGRRIYKGHTHGEIVIASLARGEEDEDAEIFEGVMKIPFINENLMAEHVVNGETTIVAGVPDLICVLDAQNGQALGTPEYKYGLHVLVLGMTAHPLWTNTQRGLDTGSLTAFGFDVPYKPIGVYVEPRSVIEEYA